jgi:hypothetical protein
MQVLNERERYVSDMGMMVAGVPMLICGTIAAALGAGYILAWLFDHGWYFIILMPALLALALGGVLHMLVAASKCRNHWLAGGLGAVAGVLAYVGYFYFCMQQDPNLPPQFNGVEFLPHYIAARMATDVQEDVGKPQINPRKPVAFMNWMLAGCEMCFFVGIASSFGWCRARRAYSRDLRRWAQKEEVQVAPYYSENLLAAWQNDDLPRTLRDAPPVQQPQIACKFIVEWFDDGDASPLDHPVYASIEDHYRMWGLQTMRYAVLRQVELTTIEALSLRASLPKLSGKLDVKHPELQVVPAAVIPTKPAENEISMVATVTPVPEPYCKQVLNGYYAWNINIRDVIPLIYFLGGVGLVALGAWLGSKQQVVPCVLLVIIGIAGFVWGCYTSQLCLCIYGNRWAAGRLRNELAKRPNLVVDLNDAELQYISIIPREAFSKIRWTMSSDLLLMKIDPKRKEIRMEGDVENYIIPAAAVIDCQAICLFHPIDAQQQNQLWMVRLLIQRDEGEQELLISVGHIDFSPQTNRKREKIARETCARVNEMLLVTA